MLPGSDPREQEAWERVTGRDAPSPRAVVEVQAAHLPGLTAAYAPVMAHYQQMITAHMEQQRRYVLLQAVVMMHAACLVLPLVSAPLGGVAAVVCSWRIIARAREHLARLRHRLWYWRQPVRPLLLSLACAVLRTLRASKGLTRAQLPSCMVRIARAPDGGFRVWLEGAGGASAVAFASALSDALGAVDSHRFAIRSPGCEGGSDYPVPHCFGQARRLARVYAINWWRIFGVGQLICLRDVDTGLLSLVEPSDGGLEAVATSRSPVVFRPSVWAPS
jgi:hypothetical protein